MTIAEMHTWWDEEAHPWLKLHTMLASQAVWFLKYIVPVVR